MFAAAKAAQKSQIRASKKACYEGFFQSANAGDAYRIVMANTRSVMAPTEQYPEMLEGIIEGLFLRHDPSPFVGHLGTGACDEERVTDVELMRIAKSVVEGKAPGLHGVPNPALKVAIADASEMFRSAGRGTAWFYCPRRGNHPKTRQHRDQYA